MILVKYWQNGTKPFAFLVCWQVVQQNVHPGYWTHDSVTQLYLTDIAFTHDVYFIAKFPAVTSTVIYITFVISLLIAALVFWTNFLGDWVSPGTYVKVQMVNQLLNVGFMGLTSVFVGVTVL